MFAYAFILHNVRRRGASEMQISGERPIVVIECAKTGRVEETRERRFETAGSNVRNPLRPAPCLLDAEAVVADIRYGLRYGRKAKGPGNVPGPLEGTDVRAS